MRFENTLKNLRVAWIGQLLQALLQFVGRTVFIMVLGREFLGINEVFANVLGCLSLAELGVETAILYILYKPIAQEDKKTIAAIMTLFKRVYMTVGTVIFLAGVALIPFLKYIIQVPDIPGIYLIYLIYLANTAVSYFFSYKATLINANQQNRVVSWNNTLFYMARCLGQILALLLTRSYMAYLLVHFVCTVAANYRICRIADREYPFLKEYKNQPISREIKREIVGNSKQVVVARVANTLVTSTDNILISNMLGNLVVGTCSNYYLIVNNLQYIFSQMAVAMTASVGNLGVSATAEEQVRVFRRAYFLVFWIYTFSAAALDNLFNPFILLWLGDEFLLSRSIVTVFALNFYLTGIHSIPDTFMGAFGRYKNRKWYSLAQAAVNLTFSIILTKMYGLIGIFLGTFLCYSLSLFLLSRELYACCFKRPLAEFLGRNLLYAGVLALVLAVTRAAVDLIQGNTIPWFICRMGIVCLVPNLILLVLFGRSRDFGYFKEKGMDLLKKVTG